MVTGPQIGDDWYAGVMGPRPGAGESGRSEIQAGEQTGRNALTETGPWSVSLVNAPVRLVAGKA